MEIGTYLRGVLSKSWIVVLIAVVAAGGGYLIRRDATDQYNASVTVTAPPQLAATAGGNGQYVANFEVALTTSAVTKPVAKATGVAEADLTDGLSAAQLNSSSFIVVGFTAATKARAEAVASAAAKRTTEVLAEGARATANLSLAAAKGALTSAETRQTAAQKAVDGFLAAHGYVDPNVQYQAVQSSLVQLNINRAQAVAKATSPAAFDSAITAAQTQLASLAKTVAAYAPLERELTAATSVVQSAEARYLTGQEDVATADSPTLIDSPTSSLESANSQRLKAIAIAAGIGFVLGLGFLLLIHSISLSRAERRRVNAAPAPDVPVAPTQSEPAEPISSDVFRDPPPSWRRFSDSASSTGSEAPPDSPGDSAPVRTA